MWKECKMANLDRMTARALVEAGYMPLADYVERFGESYVDEAPLVPELDALNWSKEPSKARNH